MSSGVLHGQRTRPHHRARNAGSIDPIIGLIRSIKTETINRHAVRSAAPTSGLINTVPIIDTKNSARITATMNIATISIATTDVITVTHLTLRRVMIMATIATIADPIISPITGQSTGCINAINIFTIIRRGITPGF
jgi:hypothetical protein